MASPDTIATRLREERERLGLNQTAFGKLGHTSKRSQVRYESGEKAADSEYLAGIARGGADVLYILTGERRAVGSTVLRPDVLIQVVAAVEERLAEKGQVLLPNKKAELVVLLYERFAPSGLVEKPVVERHLRLVA